MERLDNLRALIQERDFQEGKGLSNEVNIRIFCYDPKDEMAVRHFTEKLMTDQSLNCHLIEYNLYKVFLILHLYNCPLFLCSLHFNSLLFIFLFFLVVTFY